MLRRSRSVFEELFVYNSPDFPLRNGLVRADGIELKKKITDKTTDGRQRAAICRQRAERAWFFCGQSTRASRSAVSTGRPTDGAASTVRPFVADFVYGRAVVTLENDVDTGTKLSTSPNNNNNNGNVIRKTGDLRFAPDGPSRNFDDDIIICRRKIIETLCPNGELRLIAVPVPRYYGACMHMFIYIYIHTVVT